MTVKLWLIGLALAATPVLDPLAVVEPAVALSAPERTRLGRGELVSRVLPAHKGQMAVFAATRISVEPARLIAATNDIAALKKSRFVAAIQRFSDPPQPADLEALTLDQHDLDVLATCEVGRCSFKLS